MKTNQARTGVCLAPALAHSMLSKQSVAPPPTPAESGFTRALEELDRSHQMLSEATERMAQRLQPLMVPDVPTPGGPDKAADCGAELDANRPRGAFAAGDVIQCQGPSVPRELWDKWFRVMAVTDVEVVLSRPYVDRELTKPYRAQRS